MRAGRPRSQWSQRQNSGAFLEEKSEPPREKTVGSGHWKAGTGTTCSTAERTSPEFSDAVILRRFSDGVNFYEVIH